MTQKQEIEILEAPEAQPMRTLESAPEPYVQIPDTFNPINEIRSFHRFHFRLTLLYGGAVMLTIAMLVGVFYHLWSQAEIAALQKRLISISENLAQGINADAIAKYPLKYKQKSPLYEHLFKSFQEAANRDKDVDSIYILRPSSVPTQLYFFVDFAKTGRQAVPGEFYPADNVPVLLKGFTKTEVENKPYEDEFGITLSAYSPLIASDGTHVGLVGVDVKASQLASMRSQVLLVSLIILLISLAIIALVSYVVARSIREPLVRLILGTGAVARGNLDVRLRLSRADEFGLLGKYFDKMAEELEERQQLRDLFGRYLSEDVARSVLARNKTLELGGQEAVVTVLFCDLKDYTSISERLSPMQMVSMINEYLGEMNLVIDQHHGCVIEFLGDGILAVFGAPQSFSEHAEMGVRCAIAMRSALQELNRRWEEQGIADRWHDLGINQIECRIGLHTGPVVAGNLGSRTRMKYAVIGDSVNVAARLEVLNKEHGTSILISDEVVTRLPNDLREQCRKVGITVMKGRQQTVVSYSI